MPTGSKLTKGEKHMFSIPILIFWRFFYFIDVYLIWASQIAQLVKKIRLQCRRPRFDSLVRKICWRRDRLPTPVFLGFPYGSAGKESICNVGDLGSILGLGRSPAEGKGYPLQYSGLENLYSPWGCKDSDKTEWLSLHIADLHCCVHFCYIAKRLRYTCWHSFSYPFPLLFITEYWM